MICDTHKAHAQRFIYMKTSAHKPPAKTAPVKAAHAAKRVHTASAPEKTLADRLLAQLDHVEREIQSLAGQFAQVDQDAKAVIGPDRLFRMERLSALADRSKAGTDAIAAPPHNVEQVAPTSQPPAGAKYIQEHGLEPVVAKP